jgi:short-subunit dehydrogenase
LKINPKFKSHIIQCDIGELEQSKTLIQKSIELMGGIDVLILNAGIGCLSRLDAIPEKDLHIVQDVMNVNYFANAHLTYYALDSLVRNRGMIIVNSSIAGVGWSPERTVYSASKHALRGFFNSLRCEIGDQVQITTVYPGFVLTELHDTCYGSETLTRKGEYMTAEKSAELILQGAADKVRDYNLTWLGALGYRVNPILGRISDIIAIRKAQSGIARETKSKTQ